MANPPHNPPTFLPDFISRHWTAAKYLVVGGYNTMFGFACFALLYFLLDAHLHYIAIAIIANIIAITNAFLAYRYLVFGSTGNIFMEYLRSYLVYGAAAIISILLLALLVELFAVHPVLAQLLVTIVTVVFSYFGHRHFTFGS